MLSIVICEDDLKQRSLFEKYVENYLMIENLDAELVLSTDNPEAVMAFLSESPKRSFLYILDVDLQAEMNGLELAAYIRKFDDHGKLIFVTTHDELAYLTFTYKVEAMDYIIKGDPIEMQKRICECIQLAYDRSTTDQGKSKKLFKLKIHEAVRSIPVDEIMFFESSVTSHKIIVHLENGQIEFYGALKEIEKQLPEFYRGHKSYLINTQHISELNKRDRVAVMSNGETCFVSVRALRALGSVV